MAIFKINGNKSENKNQGRGAYINAQIRSLEAVKKFPELRKAKHKNNVAKVKNEVVRFTKFQERSTQNSSNFYHDNRKRLPGYKIPGASLTFDFSGQRNFTKTDAIKLHRFLEQKFPHLPINIGYGDGKARCIVHVGTR